MSNKTKTFKTNYKGDISNNNNNNNNNHVIIAFYAGKGDSPIIAKLIKLLSGDFTHVEILFPDVDRKYVATSIVQDEGQIFNRPKSFGRKEWHYLTITSLSDKQMNAMQNFVYEVSHASHPNNFFNFSHMVCSISPFVYKSDKIKLKDGWFCSK